MEVQYVVDMAFAVVAFFIGWVLKRIYHSIDELWKKHDEHTRRLTELAIELPKQYVTKNDLSKAIDIIHERFDKIDAKLDQMHTK